MATDGPVLGIWSGRLSIALAGVAALAAGATFFVDGVLGGPAVAQGNARGTALVVLVVAVPVLLVAHRLAWGGSYRALIVLMGSLCYLLYNSVMFLVATPFNPLFLVYVAMLSLSIWSIAAMVVEADLVALGRECSPAMAVRPVCIYAWSIVGANLALWLKSVVPPMFRDDPASFLEGSGATTNAVIIQDLAIWFPAMVVSAAWLWQHRSRGVFGVGAILTLWVIESVSVASDQWFGHRADPTSSFASDSVVAPFAVLAVVGLIPLAALLRGIRPPSAQDRSDLAPSG